MSVTLVQIEALLEDIAPRTFAEEWDNSGFNVELHNAEIKGVMICLDVTSEVIAKAAEQGCGLIISHHPLLFRAIKKVDMKTHEGRCLKALLENGISLYCAHTSMDSAPDGINTWLADVFSLQNRRYIESGAIGRFYEVAVHVPLENVDDVRDAMTEAGAGQLGNYSGCTFNISGTGTFLPNEQAHPYIGHAGAAEVVKEVRISAICEEKKLKDVLYAIRKAHPYEEPAICALRSDEPQKVLAGLGIVGDLVKPMKTREVLDRLKNALQTDSVRVAGDVEGEIKRIGVCGGAAGEFWRKAEELGAGLFIAGEIKHNDYIESHDIVLVEAGHFDTEKCFCKLYAQGLQKRLDDVNCNVALYVENLQRPYVNY